MSDKNIKNGTLMFEEGYEHYNLLNVSIWVDTRWYRLRYSYDWEGEGGAYICFDKDDDNINGSILPHIVPDEDLIKLKKLSNKDGDYAITDTEELVKLIREKLNESGTL